LLVYTGINFVHGTIASVHWY